MLIVLFENIFNFGFVVAGCNTSVWILLLLTIRLLQGFHGIEDKHQL